MSFPKCAPLWSPRFAEFFRQFVIQRSYLYPLLLNRRGTAPVHGAAGRCPASQFCSPPMGAKVQETSSTLLAFGASKEAYRLGLC